MTQISRRRFLALAGSALATGCTSNARSSANPASGPLPPATSLPSTGTSLPTNSLPATVTTIATSPDVIANDRIVVMVELAGGNDAVNTLPPLNGTYHDLRPTLAIDDAELLIPPALDGHGLHPSLAPLVPYLDDGRLATVAGVGFPDPDRSHFVSTDRWLRADRMDETLGWLGRWLDTLPTDPGALGATALGSNGGMLLGAARQSTVIDQVNAFAFPTGLSNSAVRSLGEPPAEDPLLAAAQQAFLSSVGAVEEFDSIADAVRAELGDAPSGYGPQAGAFTTGLTVAAQLIVGDVGTRIVTVTGRGFDTHGDQLDIHAGLLADLANGLGMFWQTLDDAGMSDRVLLVTHSEFGRRVHENASEGCDHGAAGVSFVMANSLNAGLYGSIDTGDLLDGDLRPQIDPRSMYTACLDWLDADVERILGRRYDELPLLV